MRWRDDWPERPPRPKVRKLSNEEKAKILTKMDKGVKASPVLTALNYRVKVSRGRFYYEQVFSDNDDFEIMGRVTPLANNRDEFLLEVEYGRNNWAKIKQGKIGTVINVISRDKEGTFHGLGVLDQSIRTALKNNSEKLKIVKKGRMNYYYKDSENKCSGQEILFHYFDVPIICIAEPRDWYVYHRKPVIKEINKKKNAVLVDFLATNISGYSFGGTCLYIKRNGEWSVFKIRPNQSDTVESSINWLEKRKWIGW